MSRVGALSGHAPNRSPDAEALQAAFDALPEGAKSYAFGLFSDAWAHYDSTGDAAPLRHFKESLTTTALASRNERIQGALDEGGANDAGQDGPRKGGVAVSAFVERMKAKHRG